jgi:hypothetical protein
MREELMRSSINEVFVDWSLPEKDEDADRQCMSLPD